jgi:hypothetical protein
MVNLCFLPTRPRGWDTMALPEEQQWSDEKKSAVLAAIKDI